MQEANESLSQLYKEKEKKQYEDVLKQIMEGEA